MSVPPNKLRAMLAQMSAARDASELRSTNLPPPESHPVDEFELRFGGNRAQAVPAAPDNTLRDELSSDPALDADLAQAEQNLALPLQSTVDAANRKLTGTIPRRGPKGS